MPATDCSLIRAENLGLVRVDGADARRFLHAQLTASLLDMPPEHARLAAWLDASGRVLACLDVIGTPAGFDLLCPAELADSLCRRMRMYVLRARVVVSAPPGLTPYALIGDTTAQLHAAGIPLGPEPGDCHHDDDTVWLRIGPQLVYVYGTAVTGGGTGTAASVEAAEISLGRPQVDATTTATFTAHMLNLDGLGAIAFDKGCYPGQEVVTRTHNLGTPKRRMFGYRLTSGPAPEPGAEIVAASGETVGTVVRAADCAGDVTLLAVMRVDAAQAPAAVRSSRAALVRMPVPGEPAP